MPTDLTPPTSDASAKQSLGQLMTEASNPATSNIDRLSPLEIVRLINEEDARVAGAVARELPQIADAIEVIAARLRDGGRLIYVGAGTAGRLGALDAYECPPTFNISAERVIGCIAGRTFALTQASEEFEDSAEAGENDMTALNIGAGDVLVGISASGRTPYVLGAVRAAQRQGVFTVGLACNTDTPLAALVDLMIAPVVGPEVIAGSTRLKAGTAQKMVLNMISTGAMILLGKTYGNMMVDMQATNEKLRARATRIVQQATGLGYDQAAALLQQANGEAKTAILAGRAHIAPEQARVRLAAHGGMLRAALDEQS